MSPTFYKYIVERRNNVGASLESHAIFINYQLLWKDLAEIRGFEQDGRREKMYNAVHEYYDKYLTENLGDPDPDLSPFNL